MLNHCWHHQKWRTREFWLTFFYIPMYHLHECFWAKVFLCFQPHISHSLICYRTSVCCSHHVFMTIKKFKVSCPQVGICFSSRSCPCLNPILFYLSLLEPYPLLFSPSYYSPCHNFCTWAAKKQYFPMSIMTIE